MENCIGRRIVYYFVVGKTIGGVETYLKNIISSKSLCEKYLNILFTHQIAIENYWTGQDIRSYPLEFTSKFFLMTLIDLIRSKTIKPGNIIHANDMVTAFYSIICWFLLLGKVRIVITIHSILKEHKVFGCHGKNIQFLFIKIFSMLCNIIPVKIISVSQTAKRDLISCGIRESKIEVIYHGINYCGKGYFPKSLNNVGFIGRLSKEKGFLSFLVLAKMLCFYKSIFIYGLPTNTKTIDILRNRNRDFFFEGYVKDLDTIFKKVDIVCIMSKTESFCFVLLESLFRKKIIYTLNLPVINELLDDFPLLKKEIVCNNIKTMNDKILSCNLLLWDTLYKLYYQLLIEKYSIKEFINKTLMIYN